MTFVGECCCVVTVEEKVPLCKKENCINSSGVNVLNHIFQILVLAISLGVTFLAFISYINVNRCSGSIKTSAMEFLPCSANS